jgi:hypothetical protein
VTKTILKLFFIFVLYSCSSRVKSPLEPNKAALIQDFIKKQNILRLPLKINLYQNEYDLVKPDYSDSALFPENTSIGCLGILNDTTKFYFIIRMFPGDDLSPILYILNKNGTILEKSNLYVGNFGFDCGTHVFGFTTISKELIINTQDSLIQYRCDPNGKEIQESMRISIKAQDMKISKNGKIIQSSIINKIIRE